MHAGQRKPDPVDRNSDESEDEADMLTPRKKLSADYYLYLYYEQAETPPRRTLIPRLRVELVGKLFHCHGNLTVDFREYLHQCLLHRPWLQDIRKQILSVTRSAAEDNLCMVTQRPIMRRGEVLQSSTWTLMSMVRQFMLIATHFVM